MEKGNGFGADFIKSLLLTLEQTNYDEFMNLTYAVVMQSPSQVLKRSDANEVLVRAAQRERNACYLGCEIKNQANDAGDISLKKNKTFSVPT